MLLFFLLFRFFLKKITTFYRKEGESQPGGLDETSRKVVGSK